MLEKAVAQRGLYDVPEEQLDSIVSGAYTASARLHEAHACLRAAWDSAQAPAAWQASLVPLTFAQAQEQGHEALEQKAAEWSWQQKQVRRCRQPAAASPQSPRAMLLARPTCRCAALSSCCSCWWCCCASLPGPSAHEAAC